VKLYPADATTHSSAAGVTRFALLPHAREVEEVRAAAPSWHGESNRPAIDVFDAEGLHRGNARPTTRALTQ